MMPMPQGINQMSHDIFDTERAREQLRKRIAER